MMAWSNGFATASHSAGSQPGVSLLNWLQRTFAHISASHSLGLAVIAASCGVYLVLLPVKVAAARLGRRQSARANGLANLEDLVADIVAPNDPTRSSVIADELHRLRRPLWRRWSAWLLRLVPLIIQYAIVIALYYAIRDEARRLPPTQRAFAGLRDISRSALDVCCTTSARGQRTVHGHFVSGVLHHSGAFVLPLLAGALALHALWRTMPSPRTAPTSLERHTRRAARHASLLLPISVFVTGTVLPLAVVLVWIVLEALTLIVARVAEHTAARRTRRSAARVHREAAARAKSLLEVPA